MTLEQVHDQRAGKATVRQWALWGAVALAVLAAVLRSMVLTAPTLEALLSSNVRPESRDGLRVMWHGMSLIAWAQPVVLVLLASRAGVVARAGLGIIALMHGAYAASYVFAGLWIGDAGIGAMSQLVLPALIAVLAWIARPPATNSSQKMPATLSRGQAIFLFLSVLFTAGMATFHAHWGTLYSWPALLLASDTPSPARSELYAMWLFSCVVFAALPIALAWSRKAPAPAGRLVLWYVAGLVACLALSWTGAMVLGIGETLSATGPVTLGALALVTVLNRPRGGDA